MSAVNIFLDKIDQLIVNKKYAQAVMFYFLSIFFSVQFNFLIFHKDRKNESSN